MQPIHNLVHTVGLQEALHPSSQEEKAIAVSESAVVCFKIQLDSLIDAVVCSLHKVLEIE